MSVYDHSCVPNAIYWCDGIVARVRKLNDTVDLTNRTTTFISYIDLTKPKQERRNTLRVAWYCRICFDLLNPLFYLGISIVTVRVVPLMMNIF